MNPLFISLIHKGKEKIGLIEDNKTYILPYGNMVECIEDSFKTSGKKQLKPVEKVEIKPPIKPSKIIGLGWNYKAHNKELSATDNKPIIFLKPPSSIIGPGEAIILPEKSKQVDYEIELGVVVKQRCKHVNPEKAENYIAGYTIILDITARDLQWEARKKGDPWDICKGFDTFAPIGPGIVPKEYIPDVCSLRLELKVNDLTKQNSNTSDMLMKPAEVLSYVSEYMTLEAGDVIATGTPEGVGPLRHGDIVRSEIEGIGFMINPVYSESENYLSSEYLNSRPSHINPQVSRIWGGYDFDI